MSWEKLHYHYKNQDWINKPSIFAEETIWYFLKNGEILEIGAGLGQDSRYFHEHGYSVLSTDLTLWAISENREKSQENIRKWNYRVDILDVTQPLNFPNQSFDGICAHLSLHYFSREETWAIAKELHRILKPNGTIALLLNTFEDPEYWNGEYIEDDYYLLGTMKKRFFRVETARDIFGSIFRDILLDDKWETYKDSAKWIHNLIRFVWKKI